MSFLRKFTAVDLITIAMFALMFRIVGMPIYRWTGVFFPYNIGIRFMEDCILAAICCILVGKRGTLSLYAIIYWFVNFVFEGEDLVWLIGMWAPIILTELYLSTRKNYLETLGQSVLGIGGIWGMLFAAVYWVYLWYYYLLVYPMTVVATSYGITIALSIVGAVIGFGIGKKIKPLMPV